MTDCKMTEFLLVDSFFKFTLLLMEVLAVLVELLLAMMTVKYKNLKVKGQKLS